MSAPDHPRVAMPLRPSDKRKIDPDFSAGASKRLKARRDARDIMTQPGPAALHNGSLDIPAFISANSFAIAALEESMRLSKASRTQRAFQRVPRNMRRRTASHNPKRVPQRLQVRAMREMAEDNTPIVTSRRRKPRTTRARIRAETAKRLGVLADKRRRRKAREAKEKARKGTDAEGDVSMEDTSAPQEQKHTPRRLKIRRNALNEPRIPKSRFAKRQGNKTWLPTHIWHAKRAHMTDPKKPLWGFAVPLRPNEKMFRATHRTLSDHGALAWDMSYMSTIGLYGTCAGVKRVLKKLGLTAEGLWNDRGERWRQGARSWTGVLSRGKDESRREICPGTVIWNPSTDCLPYWELKPRAQEKAQVFIRVHPAAFSEIFKDLLAYTKMETPKVYIEDLRFEIGSIDITGPAAMETLLGILKPHDDTTDSGDHASAFTSLAGLTNASALPTGALLAFSIADPRLSYPPKKTTFTSADTTILMNTLEYWNTSTDFSRYPCALWDRRTRRAAFRLPTKKSLDRRKSIHPPGTPLPVTSDDPAIPLVLLATRSTTGSRATGTFTLLLPWPCVQPLWHSLVHVPLYSGGNPRFGGLRELAQAHDERSMPLFPRDYPVTAAGAEYELQSRVEREVAWAKRPKGKRTIWEEVKLGGGRKGEVANPYACDYAALFPGVSPDSFELSAMHQLDAPTTQAAVNATSLSALNSLLPSLGVFRIRITFFSQGIAQPTARVYRLPTDPTLLPMPCSTPSASIPPIEIPASQPSEAALFPKNLRAQWLALTHKASKPAANGGRRTTIRAPEGVPKEQKKALIASQLLTGRNVAAPYKEDVQGHPMCPGRADLVGFVTSGGYSLNCGKATALATVRADWALRDVVLARERKDKKAEKDGYLCIVRNSGHEVAWIAKWELV